MKLRQITETVPGLVWSNGPDGEPTHINQRMLDYSGMPFEEFRHRGWEAFVHPADYPETAKAFWHAIQTGTPYQGVMRLRRADGEFRWHDARCEPLRDRQGRIVQWYGLSVEIDEAKKAENRLRRSEANLAEAQRLSYTGSWVINPTTRKILYWSEECYRIWGFDPVQGLPYRAIVLQRIHPDDRDRVYNEAQDALRQKRDYTIDFRIVLPDGTVKYLEAIGHHLFSAHGELVEVVGTNVDVTERKRAERALRESEARLAEAQRELRQMIDTIPILMVCYSTDARRDFVNAAWKQYTSLSDEAALGTDWSIVAYPDDFAIGEKMWCDTLAKGEPVHTEVRLRRADGQYRWFAVDRVALRDESGKVIKWYGTAYDIEQRKRAEQALRESEAKFRDFAETASDWFYEMGPDYKFTLLSENAFGSGAADRIGTACWDHALDLETEPEKWRLLQETVFSRKPFRNFVYRGLSGYGSPMYVKASGKPVFDASGEFRGYRGTSTDVTAIMRAQEALLESERSARSALDGIAGLVVILAPNGELETVNRQVFEYFGRSLEELKNWGTSDAVHPEDLPRVLELFKRAIASGIPFNYELRLRRFDGEYRWFDTRHVPIREDSGRIARWYILATDIEDRTQALAQLEQMQSDFAHMNRVATMGQLTASITHEVNQPITAAVTFALAARRFLSADPPNFREVDDALSLIVKEGNRAGEVVERVRALVKKVPTRKDAVAIDDAILEVIALTRAEAANNSVSVRTQFAEGLPRVRGDRVQLQQVMLNLIVNAIQAMSGNGEGARELVISVDAVPSEGGVRVGMRDTGPGLSPESLSRLFEPFYTTKPDGMGMGLSICRSIIEAHGGRLWATRCEPRGALFQFTVPR